jgi:hypothetical protein
MARPKKEPDRKNIVGVRCSDAEMELLRRAVAKEMEKVTGGTPSLPKYLLAAALEKAAREQVVGPSAERAGARVRAEVRLVRQQTDREHLELHRRDDLPVGAQPHREDQDYKSRGGMMLLNVSPKGDGTLPRQQIDILTAIGNAL